MKGLEFNFVDTWEGWDELGVGDLCFYDVTLKEEYKHLAPSEDCDVILSILLSQSIVQFDFLKGSECIESKAFRLEVSLGEEIPVE